MVFDVLLPDRGNRSENHVFMDIFDIIYLGVLPGTLDTRKRITRCVRSVLKLFRVGRLGILKSCRLIANPKLHGVGCTATRSMQSVRESYIHRYFGIICLAVHLYTLDPRKSISMYMRNILKLFRVGRLWNLKSCRLIFNPRYGHSHYSP